MNKRFIEMVHDTLCGQLVDGVCVPGVENIFPNGSRCEDLYCSVYDAYQRLCQRLGTDGEDKDVETMINSLMEIEREISYHMYVYGAKFGLLSFPNQTHTDL